MYIHTYVYIHKKIYIHIFVCILVYKVLIVLWPKNCIYGISYIILCFIICCFSVFALLGLMFVKYFCVTWCSLEWQISPFLAAHEMIMKISMLKLNIKISFFNPRCLRLKIKNITFWFERTLILKQTLYSILNYMLKLKNTGSVN